MRKIIEGQDTAAARSDEEIDSRIEALEEEIKRLRRAGRRSDFDPASEWLAPAARTTSVTPPSRLTADVGREVLGVMRQLVEVAIAVEDGDDAVSRSAPLVAPYSSASVKDFVQKPVLISTATEESRKHYSATVQKTVQVTSSLLVAILTYTTPFEDTEALMSEILRAEHTLRCLQQSSMTSSYGPDRIQPCGTSPDKELNLLWFQ